MRAAGSFILVMFIGSALLAQGRWYELYDEAIKHVQNREWALAEQKLNSAKKLGPAPGRNRLRYGMLRTDFFPDYYLGIVYLNTGRPKESLAGFATARKQALNLQSNEFRDIVTLEAAAQGALKPAPPVVVAENKVPSAPPPTPAPTPTPAVPTVDLRPEFTRQMQRARTALAQGNYADAETAIAAARGTKIDPEATDTVLGEVRQARDAQGRLESALKNRQAGPARSELDRFAKLVPNATVVPSLRDRVTALERELADEARLNTRAGLERRAMQAFYRGRYQQALTLLDEAAKGMSLSSRGAFYRACSLAALVAVQPRSNDQRLVEARRLFAGAGGASAQFNRDRAYISPRVLTLLGGS